MGRITFSVIGIGLRFHVAEAEFFRTRSAIFIRVMAPAIPAIIATINMLFIIEYLILKMIFTCMPVETFMRFYKLLPSFLYYRENGVIRQAGSKSFLLENQADPRIYLPCGMILKWLLHLFDSFQVYVVLFYQ